MRVTVQPHDPAWPKAFARESRAIHAALGRGAITLHHIGSTAIPGMPAKPIIDMLGVVRDPAGIDRQAGPLRALGYEAMGAHGIVGRRYFRKSDPAGLRTHHLHVFAEGAPHVARHLAFRDYLRAHPDVAAQYAALKAQVLSGGAVSAAAYVAAKDPFIARIERDALRWSRSKGAG